MDIRREGVANEEQIIQEIMIDGAATQVGSGSKRASLFA